MNCQPKVSALPQIVALTISLGLFCSDPFLLSILDTMHAPGM